MLATFFVMLSNTTRGPKIMTMHMDILIKESSFVQKKIKNEFDLIFNIIAK